MQHGESPLTSEAPFSEWKDLTLEIDDVMRRAVPASLWMALITFVPYVVLHGLPWPHSAGLFFARLFLFIVAYLVSVIVHELIHVVAMIVFGRVPLRSIAWGHRLSEGVLYVHSNEPMSARAYRLVLVLPGVLTGLAPAVWGVVIGNFWITFYGWVMMASAIGDIEVLRLMQGLPSSVRVVDHPEKVGLLVEPGLDVQEVDG